MKIYLDSSAGTKLVVEEPETGALIAYLGDQGTAEHVSSILFETELRRAAHRRGVPEAGVTALIERVNLAEAPRAVFRLAATLVPPSLGSLDAIHLATALREDVDVLVTYDQRLQLASREAGLAVIAPA